MRWRTAAAAAVAVAAVHLLSSPELANHMELAREWGALGCDKVVAMRPSERAEYDSSPNTTQTPVAIPSSFPPLMRSK
jgi:hypothetical protein